MKKVETEAIAQKVIDEARMVPHPGAVRLPADCDFQ
jgi:hypothetical protein